MSNKYHASHHHYSNHKFIFGTSDDDLLNGTNKGNSIFGFAGGDEIHGQGGNDWLSGGKGNDLVDGGDGNDDLSGGKGNDGLAGGKGNDDLDGDHGRDFLVSGAGRDSLKGGHGADKFVIRQGTGVDKIVDLHDEDRIDLRDFNFASAQDAINAFQQFGHDAVLDLGGGDKLIVQTRGSRSSIPRNSSYRTRKPGRRVRRRLTFWASIHRSRLSRCSPWAIRLGSRRTA
jgi:Ca2+-binding RTX toxin-like protein